MMDRTTFRIIVDSLLLAVLVALLVVALVLSVTGAPTRGDLERKIDDVDRHLVVITCQLDAISPLAAASCQIDGEFGEEAE